MPNSLLRPQGEAEDGLWASGTPQEVEGSSLLSVAISPICLETRRSQPPSRHIYSSPRSKGTGWLGLTVAFAGPTTVPGTLQVLQKHFLSNERMVTGSKTQASRVTGNPDTPLFCEQLPACLVCTVPLSAGIHPISILFTL